MSDLQPRGVPVTIAGEERKLLLSLSAIDHIQELYPGKSVYSVHAGNDREPQKTGSRIPENGVQFTIRALE